MSVPVAEVTFYNVVLFFHILAVVLAFGPTFAYPVFLAVAERMDPRALPVVGKGIETWEKIGMPLLVLVLGTGIYLVADSPAWSFSDFYVSWGFVAVVIIGGMSGAFFPQKSKRLLEIAERDIAAAGAGEVELSQDYHQLSAQIARGGQFVGVVVTLTIYVMTAKPFL